MWRKVTLFVVLTGSIWLVITLIAMPQGHPLPPVYPNLPTPTPLPTTIPTSSTARTCADAELGGYTLTFTLTSATDLAGIPVHLTMMDQGVAGESEIIETDAAGRVRRMQSGSYIVSVPGAMPAERRIETCISYVLTVIVQSSYR